MNQSRLSLLALHFVAGIGDHLAKQLISYCGSAEQVFKTPKGKLLKIPGIGEITATAILTNKPFQRAEQELLKAEKEKAQLLFYLDSKYPSRLKTISDAPFVLFCKGNLQFENRKAVAIVGTRQATAYGKQCVEEIIEQLVPHNALIISGLAYGIDVQAHKQAIKHTLQTIAVMGSGLDNIYPTVHKEIAFQMQENGGLVTEHAFGTKPDAHNFPMRNRIIAGLCDALIIVEAAERGGALITAELANSYNKDVFAFPGNIGQSHSEGCNSLIKRNKAHLITSVKDLEYLMNWNKEPIISNNDFSESLEDLETDEKEVVKTLMIKNPMQIDELSWRTTIPVSQLASILLGLEFKNKVQSLPGKQYRIKRN